MTWHASPVASHRCHVNCVFIGVSPLYVPMFAVSWRPIPAVPAMSGCVSVLGAKCGLSTIGNVWFVIAVSDPCELVPVIQTRMLKPMSATAGVYVELVAPGIGTHVSRSPTGLQRRQEYVNVIGSEPSQTPAVRVRGVSTTLPPLISGVVRTLGAIAMTTSVGSEFCDAEPSEFVAVTCTRSRFPRSALEGV